MGSGQRSREAKYPFTVDITSEIGDLVRFLCQPMKIKSLTIHPLVPVTVSYQTTIKAMFIGRLKLARLKKSILQMQKIKKSYLV